MRRKIFKRLGIGFAVVLVVIFIFAKVERITPLAFGHKEVNQPVFSNEAINGYDAVSYFSKAKAEKGDAAFTYEWKGANWFFSTDEHLNLFKANPEKYEPQFGGYCAFAVSKGFTANTDPEVFKIINDKLYLCSDKKVMDELTADGGEGIKKAAENWK